MTKLRWSCRSFVAVVAGALTFLCAPAGAAVVTYSFGGTVTFGDFAGEALSGRFTYDTATPGSGSYAIPNSSPFQFSIGPRTGLSAFVGDIFIRDEVLSGSDRLALGGPLPPGGVFPTGFTLILDFVDSTRTAFADNALTDTLPAITAFDMTSFQIREFISGIQILNSVGTLDRLTRVVDPPVQTVPVPPTLLLLAAGCAVMARRQRRSSVG